MTEIVRLAPNENLSGETLAKIIAAAKSCRIVAFPTDTVYGLGTTGLVKAATRKIYQVKNRSTLKPLPIFVKSAQEAKRWVQWSPAAELLAKKFWPGPLTLVLRPTEAGRVLTFAEYPTLAIRVPAHPVILKILEASDIPWVSTSANRSGSAALHEGSAVAKEFDGAVDFIIDAGAVSGVESTLVDASALPIRILREGALSAAAIMETLKT